MDVVRVVDSSVAMVEGIPEYGLLASIPSCDFDDLV